MNFKCVICSELFTSSSVIHGTHCGHLFHFHCLLRWLEQSKTCPQCRSKTKETNTHRIYLSVEETPETVDISTLHNKLDNLQFQMTLKEKDIKHINEKYQTAKKQNVGLREEIKTQENQSRVLESTMHALKEQVVYFKSKSKDYDKLEDELKRMKDKLRDMEHVELVVTGSRNQVNDMLRHNRDPHALALLVSTLKKELIDSDKHKKELQARFKEAQSKSQNYKHELTQLNKHNNQLQQEITAHKHCETERQYLKNKVSELSSQMHAGSSPNTSIKRIMNESPFPVVKVPRLNDADCVSRHISPTVQETVQAIKDSDSPYLQIQPTGMAISRLINYNSKYQSGLSSSRSPQQYSIFKHQSLNVENVKKPSVQLSYDGLGGHSKEDEYPIPKQTHIASKRPKSSTVTSSKYRKLAPGPQKK